MSRSRRQKRAPAGQAVGRRLGLGLAIGVGAFLVSAVLAAFGFFAYTRSFLQSERFHRLVERKLSGALRAEVELGETRWEGSSAFADRASGHGREDAAFQRFGLAGLRADLDLGLAQFKRRVWKVTDLAVSQLDVVFAKQGRLAPEPSGPVAEPAAGSSRNLLAQLIPREMELDRIRLAILNLYWESPASRVGATGMDMVLQPGPGPGGSYDVKVRGGTIQGTAVPKLAIESLKLRWRERDLFVQEARLRSEEGAALRLEGDIHLAGPGDPGTMRLLAGVTELQLSRLAGRNGRSRVQGDLEISSRIEGDPADPRNARQEGRVALRNGVVETVPLLEMLARFTGSKRFERIALRDGGGARFVREQGRTVFSEIDFQSDGLARLTGDLTVEDGRLDGLLQLGVLPGVMAWIPAAEQKIFTENREGYLWTPVRVTGTVDRPEHDLTARLASAGVQAAVDALGRLLDGGAKAAPGPDGSAPKDGAESLGKALDLGRELLKGFLR